MCQSVVGAVMLSPVHALVRLVLVAFVAVGCGAPRDIEHLCAMTGAVRPHCCCQSEAEHVAEPAIERPDCCELRRAPSVVPDVRSNPSPAGAHAVVLTRFSIDEEHRVRGEAWWIPQAARGPPSIGPPIYLRDCSFLI
jgi:hypothetical protein